jgi:hypothetical protein
MPWLQVFSDGADEVVVDAVIDERPRERPRTSADETTDRQAGQRIEEQKPDEGFPKALRTSRPRRPLSQPC